LPAHDARLAGPICATSSTTGFFQRVGTHSRAIGKLMSEAKRKQKNGRVVASPANEIATCRDPVRKH
jgi:hypothetical protein